MLVRLAAALLASLVPAPALASIPVHVGGQPFAQIEGVEQCDSGIRRLDCVAVYDGTPTPLWTATPTPTPNPCQLRDPGWHWSSPSCPNVGPCECLPGAASTATPRPTATPTTVALSRIFATDEGWQRCITGPLFVSDPSEFGFAEVANVPLGGLGARANRCAPKVMASLFTVPTAAFDDRELMLARSRAVNALERFGDRFDGFYVGEDAFPVWAYGLATGGFSLTRDTARTETVQVPVTRAVKRCTIRQRKRVCTIEHRPVVACRFDRAVRRRVCEPKTRTETRTITDRTQIPGDELPDPLAPGGDAGLARQAGLIRELCADNECLTVPYLPSWTSDGRWDDDTPLLDTVAPLWADGWLRALQAQYPAMRVAWQLSNCSRPAWTEARLRFLGAWLPVVNLAHGLEPELQIEACKDRSFERPDGSLLYDFPPVADCAALAAAEQIDGTKVRVWPDLAASTASFAEQLALCPPKGA